jgi:hypothetical protein
MHPDSETNKEILIGELCAKLDIARQVLGKLSALQAVTPHLVQLKHDALWALSETDPNTIGEQHPNHG